ncbi:MAG TPA: GNAT family N-acetyltransferase [Jatrophihabitantaceae bacterium]|jgi:GNAT superfamily N-acetyltransferase|nr:GNAT family N-acetyltransferase [Jatrophihabitantaceae bacterium]
MGLSCSLSVGWQKIGRVVTVEDATAERWDDLAVVMGTRGDPSRCWCQWFRLRNSEFRAASVAQNRAALRVQAAESPPPGVLAYDEDGAPAGWCAVAPRAAYPRLATSTLVTTPDEDGLWAVTCFVVRTAVRRRGLAEPLLDGAIELARRHGARAIEAYPVDVAVKKPSSSELYHGPLSVFLRAGFTEVGNRPKPARTTVRLTL